MGPGFFVIAILGCADGSAACTPVATMPTRYESRDACAAATGAALAASTDFDFPTLRCRVPRRPRRRRRPIASAARRAPGRRAPGLSAMADTDVEPMIHEDALPGSREPSSSPSPTGSRAIPARAGSRARSRSSPAPTAASAARSPRCSPAKAPTSPSSICASMTMPRRPRRSSRREGRRAILVPGDLGDKTSAEARSQTGGRHASAGSTSSSTMPASSIPTRTFATSPTSSCKRTFQTNIFSMFYLVQAALPHLKKGAAIINCTSVTMYKGSEDLLDYSATKGAITAFTRSLSAKPGRRRASASTRSRRGRSGLRSTRSAASRPRKSPISARTRRWAGPASPTRSRPAFLFLACEDASYMTGQVLHPNGGIDRQRLSWENFPTVARIPGGISATHAASLTEK